MRGGANGARIRLEPRREWLANDPGELAGVLEALAGIRSGFNDAQTGDKRVSLADVIVLGGAAAIERAPSSAGRAVEVPFAPGRTDASAEQTDAESFALLEPIADGFRNYFAAGNSRSPAETLVEKAAMLNLTSSAPWPSSTPPTTQRRTRRHCAAFSTSGPTSFTFGRLAWLPRLTPS